MSRNERINAQILQLEQWANDQIAALEYRMARPPSYSKDRAGYNAHAANLPKWQAEIAEIEQIVTYVSDCLEADRFGESRPDPPSHRAAVALTRFS